MLLIEITDESGTVRREEVQQVQFVLRCPHCSVEFKTIDPDQIYCKPSHGVRAREHRRILRECARTPLHTASR